MDLVRHFKTQWSPLRNKETAKDAHSKSPYTKALPGLRIRVPRFDIRGNHFGAIPATVPFIIQQSCVFNLSLDNRGPFQDKYASFKSPGHNGIGFPTVLIFSLLKIQCLQPVHAEQKMHPSTQQNSGLKRP
ncbi:hypothetical protein TNCT_587501 [Trichonephila clavata]|uniref:Uncharacterized protein n=1 Tax=Trichonephila clavata TaxID=2740835 RepID=A0A8X6G247_TRICU|nr:hypothetical protein TNCT_587501 [Trichonephila clavata]